MTYLYLMVVPSFKNVNFFLSHLTFFADACLIVKTTTADKSTTETASKHL